MSDSKFQTYFVRHTRTLAAEREDLRTLFDRDRFAIHYPGPGETDLRTIDPSEYPSGSSDRTAMKTLNTLLQNGGYVWAQYYFTPLVKIGFVEPNTEVEFFDSTWARYESRLGDPAILKAVPMTKVRTIKSGEQMVLRATRPRQGTISRWPSAGQRVEYAVEGRKLELSWKNLSPSQQEVACAEFLREESSQLPTLSTLVLPPGRTLKDIDIVGVATDGEKLLAQVTYLRLASAEKKVTALQPYRAGGEHLLLFCRAEEVHVRDGVTVIPVANVEEWLLKNRDVTEWFVRA